MKHKSQTVAEFLEDEPMSFQLFVLLTLEEQGILNDKILYKKIKKRFLKEWHMVIACYRLGQMLESRAESRSPKQNVKMVYRYKMKNTFVNCFRIAKKNKGVLYWRNGGQYHEGHFVYSPVKDQWGAPLFDFRTENRYGKELGTEDRKSFYKVKV